MLLLIVKRGMICHGECTRCVLSCMSVCVSLFLTHSNYVYNRTWHDDKGAASLNSEGLPNNGIDYYISSSTIQETMGDNPSNKPYMVSISGKNLEQNLDMLKKIAEVVKNNQDESSSNKIAAVELNLACPNIGKAISIFINVLVV